MTLYAIVHRKPVESKQKSKKHEGKWKIYVLDQADTTQTFLMDVQSSMIPSQRNCQFSLSVIDRKVFVMKKQNYLYLKPFVGNLFVWSI